MTNLVPHVQSIPKVLSALEIMRVELSSASTYETIRKTKQQAEAIAKLYADVDEVKSVAEDVILEATIRIGEEIEKVPKAKVRLPKGGKSSNGRENIGIPHTTRNRFKKLAEAKPRLKEITTKLREQGKNATVTAVLREVAADKKEKRDRIRLIHKQKFDGRVKHFIERIKEFSGEVKNAEDCLDKFSPEARNFVSLALDRLKEKISNLQEEMKNEAA